MIYDHGRVLTCQYSRSTFAHGKAVNDAGQPGTAIRVAAPSGSPPTMISRVLVDGYTVGVDAATTTTVQYSLFTDNGRGVQFSDTGGDVRKSTLVEQSEAGVFASWAGAADDPVTVADSILVNNQEGLHGQVGSGGPGIVGHHLLYWANGTDNVGALLLAETVRLADPLFVDPWSSDYRLYVASPAAFAGNDSYHLGAFGLVLNGANLVQITLEPYEANPPAPTLCPMKVNLSGGQVVADVNANGQVDDCFPGAYGVPIDVSLPANVDPAYPRHGVLVTFPAGAPYYEGPADQGGIWGYWWYNTGSGRFLHVWPFWSTGTRQTAATVASGTQGVAPRFLSNLPRLFARFLGLPTRPPREEAPAAPPPARAPDGGQGIASATPVIQATASLVVTLQRATLSLAGQTIAVHVTDSLGLDDVTYVFGDHLGSASALADSGQLGPGRGVRASHTPCNARGCNARRVRRGRPGSRGRRRRCRG